MAIEISVFRVSILQLPIYDLIQFTIDPGGKVGILILCKRERRNIIPNIDTFRLSILFV